MVCYGGACDKKCPMFEIHNPRLVECELCGKSMLNWYLKNGLCPDCNAKVKNGACEGLEKGC